MFAGDNFLVESDFKLHLRRDLIEATTTGISFDGYYRQAIAISLANGIIGVEKPGFYFFAAFVRFASKCGFLFVRFLNNFLQLGFLFLLFQPASTSGGL